MSCSKSLKLDVHGKVVTNLRTYTCTVIPPYIPAGRFGTKSSYAGA